MDDAIFVYSFGFFVRLFIFWFVRRCDDFGPKIVKTIGAILAIFRQLKFCFFVGGVLEMVFPVLVTESGEKFKRPKVPKIEH